MSQYEDDIMEVSSTDNSININIGENKDTIISLVGKYVHRGADSGSGGSGGGVGGLNIITSEMLVPSSDNSVYSSLRTDVSFLNKETTSVQRVQGEVQFGEKLILNDQGEIPLMTTDFIDAGGQIRGAQLTKDGIFTAAGIKAMSFEVFELIYNTIKAQGGTFAFSNSANIENVWYTLKKVLIPDKTSQGDEENGIPEGYREIKNIKYNVAKNYYEEYKNEKVLEQYITFDNVASVELAVKKDEANKAMPFRNGDILYGYANKIGESGQPAEGGQCIMHVISDNRVLGEGGNMVFEAELFPIGSPSENPYGEVSSNILPVPTMALAQRGNVYPVNENRLTSFFIDTSSANMYMLSNVTSPNLDVGSYGLVLGKLPDSLWSKFNAKFTYVQPNDPVIYAKYGIFENFLQFDHLGNIIPKERSRGEWDADIAAGIKKDEKGNLIEQYKVTNQYYDTVTYDGELYKCTQSDNTEKPSTGYGWMKLVSKGVPGLGGPFKSIVFARATSIGELNTPTGGSYNEPWPTKIDVSGAEEVIIRDTRWSDGIPEGDGAIYSSCRMFYVDDR